MRGAKNKEMFEISDLRREILDLRSVCRGVCGGVLLCFHTYIGSGYFLGFKIFNFNIFWVFQKTFGGMKILWIFFGGHHKIGLYFEDISMHFRVFSEGQGTEWRIFFWVAKISNIFLGVLEILDIFGGER